MMLSVALATLLLTAGTTGKAVLFRVICMQAQRVEVSVNGLLSNLAASDPAIPFYTGTVTIDQSGDLLYQYVVDGKPEVFPNPYESSPFLR